MNEIWISQFDGYSREDILEYLSLLEGDRYGIFLPKTKALYEDRLCELADEYLCMALLGDKLNALATSFGYFVPRLDRRSYFKFEVQTGRREELAGVLYTALAFLDPLGERFEELSIEAHAMIQDYEKGQRACYEFFVIACFFMVCEPGEND